MRSLQVICIAVCLLGAFAPSLGQDACACTKFYIQNAESGDVITYEQAGDTFRATEAQGLPQQLWEYKGQLLYNTLNNNTLTVGTCVGNTCILTLTPGTASNDAQKWNFNSDGSVTSLNGYTLQVYDYVQEPTNQVIAARDSSPPAANEQFNVVLSP